MSRRGTKGNPFTLGEVVLRKWQQKRGVVVKIASSSMSLPSERRYAPMRYTIDFGDGDVGVYGVRALEAIERG